MGQGSVNLVLRSLFGFGGVNVQDVAVINGQGGYSTGFFEIGLWLGFGEVWTVTFVRDHFKTYLGGARDRFHIVSA